MSSSRFKNWRAPKFDRKNLTKWNWMCQYHENLKLGKFTDIGAFTYINAKRGVIIEDYVQIGSHCAIYSISTVDNKEGKVVIKRGARIGTHSTIMPNVTIGEYALIGAHSFVNRDIPARTLAYGIPAKIIRKLSKEEINKYFEQE